MKNSQFLLLAINPADSMRSIKIDDIPVSMASVDIDCTHIIENIGEGTGWIIIEAPQEHQIQVKAVHTSRGDMEIEDIPPR
ncbi:MAG: hypothetical protein HMLIMOIP_000941 [Candidatus Nitrosomirales archaeon]